MKKETGRFLVAMGAIIENTKTGRILLLKRSKDKDFKPNVWEAIYGRLCQFEEPIDGLKREIMEESGIKVKIVKPISVFHFFRGEKNAENELVGVAYWCQTDLEKIKISKEHSDYEWVTVKEALKMTENPGIQKDIKAFINERKKII